MEDIDIDLNTDNYSISDIKKIFDINDDHINNKEIHKHFLKFKQTYYIEDGCDYDIFLIKLKNKLTESMSYPTIQNDKQNIISYNNPSRSDVLLNPNVKHSNDKYLIEGKTIEPKDSFLNKYPSDILNPIRKKIIKQILSIDTSFKQDGENANNILYVLEQPFKNVISMKVTSVEIPHIWYTFNENDKSNIFYIDMFNMYDGSGSYYNETYEIVIPSGNYTIVEFENTMNNLFGNIDPQRGPDFLAFRIEQSTGRVVIRANNINDSDIGSSPIFNLISSPFYSPNFSFSLRFSGGNIPDRPLNRNAGWMMGFKKAVYSVNPSNTFIDMTNYSSIITFNAYVRSEAHYCSDTLSYFYLEINDFNRNNHATIISKNDNGNISNDIIAKIPLTSGLNTFVVNTSSDDIFKQRDYFGPINIEKLRIRLLNKYGELIDMNNSNYSLSLEISQIYS